MSEVVELPAFEIEAGEDYEDEERRRREAAAADPLGSLGDDISSAVGDVMRSGDAETRALAEMRSPAAPARPVGRPQAEPSGYVEAAREVAPQEVGLGRPGARPATALTPHAAPREAPATAQAAPLASEPPPSLGGAAKSSSGTTAPRSIGSGSMRQVDTDLEAALAERNRRRTSGSVVDAIALLLGGGGDRVTQQIGVNPGADRPLEDLRLRRESSAQAEQQRARQTETARTARTQAEEEARTRARRDPTSPESLSMQDAIGRMGIGVTADQVRGISAEDLEKNGVIGALVQARARTTGTLENTHANIAGRAAGQDDAQEHQLQRDAVLNDVRLQIANLRRRPGGGSGGGGGGGQNVSALRSLIARSSMASGMSEEDATALASNLPPREVVRRASGLQGALSSAAVRGDEVAERAALSRVTRYHEALDKSGAVSIGAALDDIEGAMRGASDETVQAAVGAMMAGPSAVAGLDRINPQAARLAQSLSRFQNVELKEQSGAAVSDQEYARFRSALGTGSVLSAGPLRNGIAAARRAAQATRSNIDAGYRDVIAYEQTGQRPERGPILAPPSGGASAAPAGTVRVRARNGRIYPVPEANLAAALADGGVRVDGP